MTSPRRTCPSGKTRFRDHRHAVAVLHASATARQRADEDGLPTRRRERRDYECDECGGWHLTSRETWGPLVAVPLPRVAAPGPATFPAALRAALAAEAS